MLTTVPRLLCPTNSNATPHPVALVRPCDQLRKASAVTAMGG